MMASRRVEPELLDELPPDDPLAQGSRRDLQRINMVMLQAPIMARALLAHAPAPRRLIDLGSGDGLFLLDVARWLAKRWPGVHVTLVDKQNIVTEKTRATFAGFGWTCDTKAADVFDFLGQADPGSADIVTANLFLHHFDAPDLKLLLARASMVAPAFLACEPRRARGALIASSLVFAIGANAVSRNDAVASVRAGFRGNELSQAWPAGPWQVSERWAPPFSHLFVARRHDV